MSHYFGRAVAHGYRYIYSRWSIYPASYWWLVSLCANKACRALAIVYRINSVFDTGNRSLALVAIDRRLQY